LKTAAAINLSLFSMAELEKRIRKRPILTQNINPSEPIHGKLPPQALDIEEAVLGALLLDKDALAHVIDSLRPETFYKTEHQKIFETIQDLFNQSKPVDILTVVQDLRKKGDLDLAGGAAYIGYLTNRIGSTANVEFHTRILNQKQIQRELISVSSNIINKAYEEGTDALELLDEAEKELFAVGQGNIKKNFSQISDLIIEAKKQIEQSGLQPDGLSGIPSGFTALDRMTAGWQRSDLLILAARPGMGKTAFVLALARNAAVDFKKPVAVFSLEMSKIQLVMRLISGEAELSNDKLKRGKLENHEWHQLDTKIRELSEAPLFIDDTPAMSIFELRAKARRLKANHDIQMIIIDYLQLMTAGSEVKGGNREQEISMISRSLKGIAKELDIPVIALSQLSRNVEQRGASKVPQLSDLRESGAIEQDADMVMFIYRPEYYQITETDDGRSTAGLAEIHIAKHRNGALGSVGLRYIGDLAKFTNLDSSPYGFSSGPPPDKGSGNASTGMKPNASFDQETNSIIMGSKMNQPDPWDSDAIQY
jgi:replicative DNA helicase